MWSACIRAMLPVRSEICEAGLDMWLRSDVGWAGPSSEMPSSELSERETMESGRSFPELTMSDLASSEGSPGSQVVPAFRASSVARGIVKQTHAPLQ